MGREDARRIGGTTDAAGVDDETSERRLSATYLPSVAHGPLGAEADRSALVEPARGPIGEMGNRSGEAGNRSGKAGGRASGEPRDG